jgi:hypothetical protein
MNLRVGSKVSPETAAQEAEFEMWWTQIIAGKTPHYKYLARRAWFDSRKYLIGSKRFKYEPLVVAQTSGENPPAVSEVKDEE